MDKNDFSNLEDQIKDTVKNVLNSIDFDKLKKDIGVKAESTLDEAMSSIKNKSQEFNEKMNTMKQNQGINNGSLYKKESNSLERYVCKKPYGKVSGIIYMVLGSSLSAILGILLVISSIITFILGEFSIINSVGLGVLISLFGGSILLALRGGALRKRVKRFKQYVKSLKGHKYCSIEELAKANGKQHKFIVKDLKRMISLGMFKEAHIDERETYFMLSNEVYDDYLELQKSLREQKEQEIKQQKQTEAEMNDPDKKELRYTIETGNYYIKEIKSVNEAIDELEMSNKLYRLENIVSKIFSYVEKNPQKLPEVHKFIDYYLPITLKLVKAYKELIEQPIQGENINSAKNEIEKTIDIINIAFEKLLDDLFEEVAMDISTDISVLETLFAQEGLTEDDFKK